MQRSEIKNNNLIYSPLSSFLVCLHRSRWSGNRQILCNTWNCAVIGQLPSSSFVSPLMMSSIGQTYSSICRAISKIPGGIAEKNVFGFISDNYEYKVEVADRRLGVRLR